MLEEPAIVLMVAGHPVVVVLAVLEVVIPVVHRDFLADLV
jgi:hypothetical protein